MYLMHVVYMNIKKAFFLLKRQVGFVKKSWNNYRYAKKLGHFGKKARIDKLVEIRNAHNIFIGNGVKIQQGCVLRPGQNKIFIDDNSGINPYVTIYGKVNIGKYAMIAPHVMIAGGNHSIDYLNGPMIKSGKGTNIGISIADDVWIGANSVILDGAVIEKGAVVGAGSVVNGKINEYTIAAGNPAKFIRKRKF